MTNKQTGSAYRVAFVLTLIACIILGATAGMLWFKLKRPTVQAQQTPPVTNGAIVTLDTHNQSADLSAPAAESELPLAPFQISPQRLQSIGVKVGIAEIKSLNDEIRAYGNVQVNERKTVFVQTRFPGWIRSVYADASGDLVRKGQPLFTIYSPDIVGAQQEYLLAKENAARLQGSTVSGVAAGAVSLVEAAKSRLSLWDIAPADLEALENAGKAISELTISSPVDGYIAERNALPNLYVQPETKLYTISNLSDVWVLAQVFQGDSGKITPGTPADVTVDTYPGKVFRGHVDYLLPQVDMTTRTVPVRMVFENPGLQLRPGMYVNVIVKLPLMRQVAIPASAAFHSGTRNLVFVYTGDGNIEPREVELGSQVGDELAVQKGLKKGERIITSANFLIDSEAQLQAAAAGAFAPPSAAVDAAAPNAPPNSLDDPRLNIEMTTDPAPPRKGVNTVRVRLASRDGKAIPGAKVTVAFFLPAMPAMGMASMKTVVNAADNGGGMYEGKGNLGTGGTWQATIDVQQNGESVVKRMTLNVTGGM